jgi:hypothetical protein
LSLAGFRFEGLKQPSMAAIPKADPTRKLTPGSTRTRGSGSGPVTAMVVGIEAPRGAALVGHAQGSKPAGES